MGKWLYLTNPESGEQLQTGIAEDREEAEEVVCWIHNIAAQKGWKEMKS